MSTERGSSRKNKLVRLHTNFFASDIAEVKKIAEDAGLAWQIQLRMLVRKVVAEHRELQAMRKR
jgi:hypothetical protein